MNNDKFMVNEIKNDLNELLNKNNLSLINEIISSNTNNNNWQCQTRDSFNYDLNKLKKEKEKLNNLLNFYIDELDKYSKSENDIKITERQILSEIQIRGNL